MTDEERYAKIRELLTENELHAIMDLIDSADEATEVLEASGYEEDVDRLNGSMETAIAVIGRNPMMERAEQEKRAFLCVDCGTCTHETNEYYMVHDDVWQEEAHMTPHGGMLCIGCLEARIMRRLTHVDFTDAPINLGMTKQSPRLLDRLKGKPLPLQVAA